jgi:hypothetical protein
MTGWKILLVCSVILLMNACEKQKPINSKEPVKKYETSVNLQGNVSSNKGLLKKGKIEAKTETGKILAETRLENSSRYKLEIPAGSQLPIILSFKPEANDTEIGEMISVIVQSEGKQYDINPSTTRIAKQAKVAGGYTLNNLRRAAEESIHIPDANKTSTGFRGDPTTQYGGWH